MISPLVSTVLHDRTGTLVGSKQFSLSVGGEPVFKKSYNSATQNIVDLALNIISIQNHNFQTGQTVILDTQGGSKIGIATTSHTTGTKDIIMAADHLVLVVVQCLRMDITFRFVSVTGTAVMTQNPPGDQFRIYGFGNPDGGLPGISTRGTCIPSQV